MLFVLWEGKRACGGNIRFAGRYKVADVLNARDFLYLV